MQFPIEEIRLINAATRSISDGWKQLDTPKIVSMVVQAMSDDNVTAYVEKGRDAVDRSEWMGVAGKLVVVQILTEELVRRHDSEDYDSLDPND